MLNTIVAGRTGTAILLGQVLDVHLLRVFLQHLLAGNGGTILHNDHLEVLDRLIRQAFQQLVHLVGTVIHGYDDRIFHVYSK